MDAIQLRTLLNDDAKGAGFPDAFAVRDGPAKGSSAAIKLRDSESFKARWAMFEVLATRIGIDGGPGDPLTAPPAILAQCRDDYDFMTGEVDRCLNRGMGIGLVLGLAKAVFLARRVPGPAAEQAGPLPDPAVDW